MSNTYPRIMSSQRNLSLALILLLLGITGCFTPADDAPVWNDAEIAGNIQTLRSVTEQAPKQAITMVARELEGSLDNHSRAASGEVADVLSSLAAQVTEFRQAIPTESKQQLLERIKTMEQTLPSAPAAE